MRKKDFIVIDSDRQALIAQALSYARFIRYYDHRNLADGYFDSLLQELQSLAEEHHLPVPDGRMEPSQALLYSFIDQLHQLSSRFNERWSGYAYWYLNDYLGIAALPPVPDKVWLAFVKGDLPQVSLPSGTTFHLKSGNQTVRTYKLDETVELQAVTLEKTCSLHWRKEKKILPAGYLNFITSMRINNAPTSEYSGLIVTSPSLLYQEGKRCISVTFRPANNQWKVYLKKSIDRLNVYIHDRKAERLWFDIFNHAFLLKISIADGWKEIREYTVKVSEEMQEADLTVKFILPEEFPETTGCQEETHRLTSAYPAIRISPNPDAWLYPYSWLKEFLLSQIIIEAQVENNGRIELYNELGRVDSSKPFPPFGVQTERGAWLVAGNYEMSLKKVRSADLSIQWQQLPTDADGLYGYYRKYENETNNHSFRVSTQYLSDYHWQQTPDKRLLPLFSSIKRDRQGESLPNGKLSEKSCLSGIHTERMVPALLTEEEYEYSIRSRTGFIRLVLEEPEMGFGEQRYRRLFTRQMLRQTFRKQGGDLLNPPLNPIIEKISLNYHSRDVIDLHQPRPVGTEVWQIYPFGLVSSFSGSPQPSVSFAYGLNTDANLLFAFSGVRGGETISLFLEFLPNGRECGKDSLPLIVWYWGNGYQWQEAPPETILSDGTHSLTTSGRIHIQIPDKVDESFFDNQGKLWLRAGVAKHEEQLSEILSTHIHAGLLVQELSGEAPPDTEDFKEEAYELVAGKKLPGVREFRPITTFYGGRAGECNRRKQLRFSGYVTHRGRAVTPRDYERLVLQTFPEVGKAKCIFETEGEPDNRGKVRLILIPTLQKSPYIDRPLARSYLMWQVEEFIQGCCSAYAEVEAINPVYEEIFVRCNICFHESYSLAPCKARLNELFNDFIAPWQTRKALPFFNYSLRMRVLYQKVGQLNFVKEVKQLSLLRISRQQGVVSTHEYKKKEAVISPAHPHIVFVPGKRHLIESQLQPSFGINEMEVNETFIINSL